MAPSSTDQDQDQNRRDRADLYDLVREERFARDHEQWERLASCYTEDSRIRVTWFVGTGREFADASVKQVAGPTQGRHVLMPMDARIVGDRAVVESDSMIQVRLTIPAGEFDFETCCRFVSWARRTEAGWRLVTFDCIYFKDSVQAVNPATPLPVDWDQIARARPSYRFLDWLLGRAGYKIDQNLAGIDKPETVAALYAEADGWLAGRLDTPPRG